MNELELRTSIVAVARSLFARGYSFGTSGNISARSGDGILVTPTGSSFESVTPEELAKVSMSGAVVGAAKPSKEAHFHLAFYRARPDAGAVVHLHSTYAVALSCLAHLNMDDALPVLTPYYAMRVGRLPVVRYLPPGDPQLAPEVETKASSASAVLLQNHGPITAAPTLAQAAALAEELEEQAKLYFILGDRGRRLTQMDVEELRKRFGSP
jgi:ribulose-5-phosphate 4-epimerase/fuculose-1-phosphate aldolase